MDGLLLPYANIPVNYPATSNPFVTLNDSTEDLNKPDTDISIGIYLQFSFKHVTYN